MKDNKKVYIGDIDTTFFTNEDQSEVLGVYNDALKIFNGEGLTRKDLIEFMCNVLNCKAESSALSCFIDVK